MKLNFITTHVLYILLILNTLNAQASWFGSSLCLFKRSNNFCPKDNLRTWTRNVNRNYIERLQNNSNMPQPLHPKYLPPNKITNMKDAKVYSHNFSFIIMTTENKSFSCTLPKRIFSELKYIFATDYAIAILFENGNVFVFGHEEFGGSLPSGILTDVKTIVSNQGAFAALFQDGNVFVWGNEKFGALVPLELLKKLKGNVEKIIPNKKGFTFFLKNSSRSIPWEYEKPSDLEDAKGFDPRTTKV